MKKIYLFACLSFISWTVLAQTTEAEKDLKVIKKDTIEGWKKGGNIGLTFSQVTLTNWAAGGLNSLGINITSNLFANYRKGNMAWDNTLDVGYGIIRQGDKTAPWIKSNDQIDFSSKYGKLIKDNLYFATLYNFRTQFSPGYEDPENTILISDFTAPAYSLLAVGVDYKKGGKFSAFLAPVTLKTTIVNNQELADAGAFGVEPAVYENDTILMTHGKMIRNEFGGYLRLGYTNTNIVKNIGVDTKLDFFANYLQNLGNIDVNWTTAITMKVNDYIMVNLSTHLIYDDDIAIAVDRNGDGIKEGVGPRIQFKEVFGVGVLFKF